MKLIKDQEGRVLISDNKTVYGFSADIDSDIVPGNIVKGAEILGVSGIMTKIPIITYVDWDGTVLFKFTKTSFLKLSAHPTAPEPAAGYTNGGWNWALQKAKDYVNLYNDDLTIGHVIKQGGNPPYTSSSTFIVITTAMLGGVSGSPVTLDEGDAFPSNYPAARSVCFPDDLSSITSSGLAYTGTNNYLQIRDVVIPNGVSIGNYLFYGNTELRSVVLPNTITGIGTSSFYNCTKLHTITIPQKVTSIGSNAFLNSGLKEIRLQSLVPPSITQDTFSGVNLDTIYVPFGTAAAYVGSDWGSLGATIIEDIKVGDIEIN